MTDIFKLDCGSLLQEILQRPCAAEKSTEKRAMRNKQNEKEHTKKHNLAELMIK